jgi:hypothetical protein
MRSFGHLKKFIFLVMAAILDTGRRWRTQLWKGTTQGSFQQILVEIGSVVSEEKIFLFSSPPFFYFELGGHLGWKSGSTDTNLEGGHPRIISAKFGWDWLSSFRGEDFFLISSPLFLGPFQNCVRQARPPFKMAAVTKNRNFFKWPKLLYFKPECTQIWTV